MGVRSIPGGFDLVWGGPAPFLEVPPYFGGAQTHFLSSCLILGGLRPISRGPDLVWGGSDPFLELLPYFGGLRPISGGPDLV